MYEGNNHFIRCICLFEHFWFFSCSFSRNKKTSVTKTKDAKKAETVKEKKADNSCKEKCSLKVQYSESVEEKSK